MSELSDEQVRELNRERIDRVNRTKAEALQAQKDSITARAWWKFSAKHAGQQGIQNGDYLSNQANDNILNGWLSDNDRDVTEQNLEAAFAACEGMLSRRSGGYTRVTDTQESRVMPQIKNLTVGARPAYAPFTRDEILSWGTARLHKEMAKGKEHVDKINEILRGQ
jgi:hypothetical protein